MLNVSFKVKMFLISLLPALALLYLSIFYTSIRYQDSQNNETFMLSAKIIQATSQFIHDLQIERGISSGYIAADDTTLYKKKLIQQREHTDKSYQTFLKYAKLQTDAIHRINDITFEQYQRSTKTALKQLQKLQKIRSLISSTSISFLDEAHFFRDTNAGLIHIIQTLTTLLKSKHINPVDIYRLELLKESAGRERAYTYNQLVSQKTSPIEISMIKELIQEQQKIQKQFLSESSCSDLSLYKKIIDSQLEESINTLRTIFLVTNFDKKYAPEWFALSTQRINILDTLSKVFIENYLSDMTLEYENAQNSLIITLILWIISVISFGVLTFIVNNMINKERKLFNDLQIASYTFDSHEAITITDPNGIVVKINKAFSEITGYSEEEIIGQSTNILKSHQHTAEFYREMWNNLLEKGFWSGEINNRRKNGEIYTEKLSITAIKDSQGLVRNYIAQFLDISALKHAQEDANYQASHDFLTELPNRKSLMQKLHEEHIRAKRHQFLNAFLFIDLDGFKQVNDTFGHAIGDKLLISVAKRLKDAVREEDYVSRMSGDEFSVLILDLENHKSKAAHDVGYIAKKILKSLNEPFFFDEKVVNISASIGAKIFPDGEKDTNDIVNDADTVMYQAKESGKNQFIFFNKQIEKKQRERTLLESEIKLAFKEKQFVFFFQAKVALSSHKIVGAELLVRWEHPHRGLLTPNHFLALAYEMNIAHEFTFLALETACNFITQNPSFLGSLSINISSYELSSQYCIEKIKKIIARHEIPASSIELEILEDELIKDFDSIIANIEELRKIGVKFSLDDFGTGYSSISYLQKLPVEILKVDRKFMQNLDTDSNKELVKTIIHMAQSFNLITVIEGVETEEQLNFIKENGANQYQGFYFSKALKEEDFQSQIDTFSKKHEGVL